MKRLIFLLKSSNLAVNSIYTFALIFVLVRVVDPTFYPWVVFLSAIGNYVLVSDLGFGGFVYADVRRNYLQSLLPETLKFISDSLLCYIALTAIAIVCATVGIWLLVDAPASTRAALALFFCSTVLGLPWTLVRRVTTAVDLLVSIEAVELVRRLVFLMLAGSMLVGLSFLLFAALCVLTWMVAFVAAFRLMRKRGIRLVKTHPRALGAFVYEHRNVFFLTGTLTGLEFLIYNLPYLLIPFMFDRPEHIVAFDVFYKISRFGGVSYGVGIETFLPSQTRAFYAGDFRAVSRYHREMIGVGLIPFIVSAVLLLLFGDFFFNVLLAGIHQMPSVLRYALIGMMAGLLIQTTAGTFLVATGHYSATTKLAAVTFTLMVLVVSVTLFLRLTFETFMFLYVGAYGIHAVMFLALFVWVVRNAKRSQRTASQE